MATALDTEDKPLARQTVSVSLRDAFDQIYYEDAPAGNCVLVESDPGVGKSDKVYELHRRLQQANPSENIGLCIDFVGNKEQVDAAGLPFRSTIKIGDKSYTITDPAMPRWYISTEGKPACEYDRVVCCLEEWGQADLPVKKAYANILLHWGVDKWYLPKRSCVILLSNIDSRDGVTKELDMTINRYSKIRVKFDGTVWEEDFGCKPYEHNGKMWNCSGLLRSWAHECPEFFCEPKPQVQGPWATARSSVANDRAVQMARIANGGELPLHKPQFIAGVTGRIGSRGAQSFLAHAEFEINLPKYQAVVNDPEGTVVPKQVDLLLLMCYKMAEQTKKEHLNECIKYMMRFPPEMGMNYVKTLVLKDPHVVKSPALMAWTAVNGHMMTMIQGLAR